MNKLTPKTLDYQTYLDKTLGSWMGKSIGGVVGAPYECHKILGDMNADQLWPKELAPNDDLDIQVVWLEMLEERGCNFSQQDLVDYWRDRCWYNFAEYGAFLNNVQRGIHPPLSGDFNNEFFSESMGCPIRAEIWGLVAPGNPGLAAEMAQMDGQLDHIGESVWAERFWAASTAAAFFAASLEECLAAGRAVVPSDSTVMELSQLVPDLWRKHQDWKTIWRLLIRRFGHRDSSKGQINFAFTILSLAAGGMDFKRTIELAVNCGWDTDCTAATAGALLGALGGSAVLPKDWLEKLGPNLNCDVNVRHRHAPLTDFASDTCKVGLEMSLSRNDSVKIVGVPADVEEETRRCLASRPTPPSVTIRTDYPGQPCLPAHGPVRVTLTLENLSDKPVDGELVIACPVRLVATPPCLHIKLPAGGSHEVSLDVSRAPGEQTIWDKNLLTASFPGTRPLEFGLAGMRQWSVYGPYWDGWDAAANPVCPFRNDKIVCNPHPVGHGFAAYRNYVRMDHPYLDEARLLSAPLPEEMPYVVEIGTDRIDSSNLGGFVGESVYYLVRNLVAVCPTKTDIVFCCTSGFIAWLDGKEIMRSTQAQTLLPYQCLYRTSFNSEPRRLVVKILNFADTFALRLQFYQVNSMGDKTVGVSQMLDSFGDASPCGTLLST